MDTIVFIIIIIALIIGFSTVIFILSRRQKPTDTAGLQFLQNQMNEMSRVLDSKLTESNKMLQEQFGQSSRVIQGITGQSHQILKDVTERLTKLDETNKQVVNVGDQIKSLEAILKNPKQRGVLGEYYLEALLKNVLPPESYKMQYAFQDGMIVDAAVFVKDKIIPIDSKFSLENYNRLMVERNGAEKERLEKLFVNDLKLRIQETAKYIRPAAGTMDFAFMFIPHEAIYYDLLVNRVGAITDDTENLIQRAAGKYRVIIVSPTSFLAYLQTVLQGLNALRIEETAKDIVKRVGELGKHLKTYEDYHDKMGNSLATVFNHYNASGKEFKKIDKDIFRITGAAPGLEAVALEKPDIE